MSSSRSMATSNEAAWLPTGPKLVNPMDQWTVSSRFMLTYYCDYNVREPKTAPGCLYYQYFGGLLGFHPFEQLEAMVKRWFLIYPSAASCGFAVYVIPICYVFFSLGHFGTFCCKWHPKQKAVPWWKRAPNHPHDVIHAASCSRWSAALVPSALQKRHPSGPQRWVCWACVLAVCHMRVVGTINYKSPKENNLNIELFGGERLLVVVPELELSLLKNMWDISKDVQKSLHMPRFSGSGCFKVNMSFQETRRSLVWKFGHVL